MQFFQTLLPLLLSLLLYQPWPSDGSAMRETSTSIGIDLEARKSIWRQPISSMLAHAWDLLSPPDEPSATRFQQTLAQLKDDNKLLRASSLRSSCNGAASSQCSERLYSDMLSALLLVEELVQHLGTGAEVTGPRNHSTIVEPEVGNNSRSHRILAPQSESNFRLHNEADPIANGFSFLQVPMHPCTLPFS